MYLIPSMNLYTTIAGTVGGVGLVLVGHPMDTCKVALQTQDPKNPMYNGFVDVVRKTWRNEGVKGFYKGMQSPLYGQAFMNAWQFWIWGMARGIAKDKDGNISTAGYFAAGALTGLFVALAECPVDLFKTQLQTGRYQHFGEAVKSIVSEHGIRGVYQGLAPTLIRNTVAVSNYFGWYELTKKKICSPEEYASGKIDTSKLLLAGAVGGTFYWLMVYPVDCIKSAMQADNIVKNRKYPTMMSVYRDFMANGGLRRFTNGFTPCMARSIPANAVCFAGYELAARNLRQAFLPKNEANL